MNWCLHVAYHSIIWNIMFLAGGLEHVFFHILGILSSQLTNRLTCFLQRGWNQSPTSYTCYPSTLLLLLLSFFNSIEIFIIWNKPFIHFPSHETWEFLDSPQPTAFSPSAEGPCLRWALCSRSHQQSLETLGQRFGLLGTWRFHQWRCVKWSSYWWIQLQNVGSKWWIISEMETVSEMFSNRFI